MPDPVQRFRSHILSRTIRVLLVLSFLALPMVVGAAWNHVLPALLCLFTGIAIRIWCNGTLHKSQEVTQVGPYSVVRHPMYVGTLFAAAGIVLIWNLEWWLRGAIFAGLVLVHILRATREEKMLMKKFEGYWDYRARVPLIFPLVSFFRSLGSGAIWKGFSWETLKYNGEIKRLGILLGVLGAIGGYQVYKRGGQVAMDWESIGVIAILGAAALFFVYASVRIARTPEPTA